jgi:glucose dehydrogenase
MAWVWEARLPTSARATPLLYTTASGRDMIAAGGHDTPLSKPGSTFVVFALPNP